MKMAKTSPKVENIGGKGEITRDEQFLLFKLCFQKTTISYSLNMAESSPNR